MANVGKTRGSSIAPPLPRLAGETAVAGARAPKVNPPIAADAAFPMVSKVKELLTGLFGGVSASMVEAARNTGDPAQVARVLKELATGRPSPLSNDNATRIERTGALLNGLGPQQIEAVRASYIAQFGADPEVHIRSDDLGQPLRRLGRDVELAMVGALNGPQMKQDAVTLRGLLEKATRGQLTPQDRQTYFTILPRMGLWSAPVRAPAGDHSLDALERTLLTTAFDDLGTGVGLDAALAKIEAAMPAAEVKPTGPREKSIAVIVSSHGAQWQELMDWAKPLYEQGYQLQLFTPDGRPVSFQRDSLLVSTRTEPLGFGAPLRLDPRGPAGEVANALLGKTASAAQFDAKAFGAVYLAGGLGFNEDVAVAKDEPLPGGKSHTVLTANPNIEKMMDAAVAERLPVIGLCHGPTLLAAINIVIDGRVEKLNKGIETASLPPFEGYVGWTGRKEVQFTYDVNTHRALKASGGQTHVLKDIANMKRVVKAHKDGMDLITGPGPQTALNLAGATVDALGRRWK